VGLVLALALAAAGVAGVVASAQTKVPTLTVSLKEYKIAPAHKLAAGKVTLLVANRGKLTHALAIAGPGVNAKTAMLAPGKTAKLTVTLKDGSYSLWCPVPGHAAAGMKLTAKIGAATTGGGTAATGGGTTGGATGGDTSTSSAGGEWG
jgi:hypothetical protein